jgi:hypothetical protein
MRRKHVGRIIAQAGFIALLTAPAIQNACAGEGNASQYVPGIQTVLMGVVPEPGPFLTDSFVWKKVSTGVDVQEGQRRLDVKSETYLNFIGGGYVTGWKVFGGDYAVSALLPFGERNVNLVSLVQLNPLPPPFGGLPPIFEPFRSGDSEFALGDLSVEPIVLGWHAGDFHWSVSLEADFPTGAYDLSNVASLGRNRYAILPHAGFTYLEPERGHEASVFLTYGVPFKNVATDYLSGQESTVEYALVQHFKFGLGLGLVGYYFQQVTGDSGSGALLGSNRGMAVAVGPVVTYDFKICRWPARIYLNWQNDLETRNRLQGNSYWAGFVGSF